MYNVPPVIEATQIVILFRVLLAFIAGVVVGYDRERSGKAAGIRTQMLVCASSALLSGISVYLGQMYGQPTADPARLMAQIVSGIGFLGAGVILKNGGNKVVGVTTAATIWVSAAIGIALGAGFYLPALLTVALVLMLNPLAALQYKIGLKGDEYLLQVKTVDMAKVEKVLGKLKIRFREMKMGDKRRGLMLVSSQQKNAMLEKVLVRRKIKFEIEPVGEGND